MSNPKPPEGAQWVGPSRPYCEVDYARRLPNGRVQFYCKALGWDDALLTWTDKNLIQAGYRLLPQAFHNL